MDIETYYHSDKIRALDARDAAQRICMGPYSFQATYALRKLGILQCVADSLEAGITAEEIARKTGVSLYGVGVLCEMGLALGLLKLTDEKERHYTIGKIGVFFLDDPLTIANLDFMQDICYKGADKLIDSLKSGRPEGLKGFPGEWETIYQAVPHLPEQAQKSWYQFDHYYSDVTMPETLPLVFGNGKVRTLSDIGGNTARFALMCCEYAKDVHVTIVDLPGEVERARENVEKAGYGSRVSYAACNVLDEEARMPEGQDAYWMSQFLDCFSLAQITRIIRKIRKAAKPESRIFVLEPLEDRQKYLASAFSLQCTSLYFTTMANGCSRMYNYADIVPAIEKGGVKLSASHHNLGFYSYTLLEFVPC